MQIKEFTKPDIQQQNAHIESYRSIMGNKVCRKFEFIDLKIFYNFKRIHSGIGYKSPKQYLFQKGLYIRISSL